MKPIYINSVGVIGPGIDDWSHCQKLLNNEVEHTFAELPKLALSILPANERRRTTAMIKMALHVASEAISSANISASGVCSVFASSNSDLTIVDRICNELLLPDHPVSPTQFHNSVHNASAGYWSIGMGCRCPSNSISAALYSAMAGLIEACTMAIVEKETVMLAIYDCPVDGLLHDIVGIKSAFACAMVLTAEPTSASFASLQLLGSTDAVSSELSNKALAASLQDKAAISALLLLESIATINTSTTESTLPDSAIVSIPYADNLQYLVKVAPFSL